MITGTSSSKATVAFSFAPWKEDGMCLNVGLDDNAYTVLELTTVAWITHWHHKSCPDPKWLVCQSADLFDRRGGLDGGEGPGR